MFRFSAILDRDYCVPYSEGPNSGKNVMIKDLRVITNRQLSNILIVDNYVYSFALHLANGIPIKTFTNEMHDESLINLLKHLNNLKLMANT